MTFDTPPPTLDVRQFQAERNSWNSAKNRCSNPNNPGFKHYGGRGIKFSDEWRDFSAFLHALGPRPTPKHSLDRINVNGHYEPGNCRWATQKQQANNTRSNLLLTHNGRTQTLALWSDETGVKMSTIWMRLQRNWPIEEALSHMDGRELTRKITEKSLTAFQITALRVLLDGEWHVAWGHCGELGPTKLSPKSVLMSLVRRDMAEVKHSGSRCRPYRLLAEWRITETGRTAYAGAQANG